MHEQTSRTRNEFLWVPVPLGDSQQISTHTSRVRKHIRKQTMAKSNRISYLQPAEPSHSVSIVATEQCSLNCAVNGILPGMQSNGMTPKRCTKCIYQSTCDKLEKSNAAASSLDISHGMLAETCATTSPATLLGAGNVDPFGVCSIDMKLYMYEALDLCKQTP
jgi:hypothetical protein